jgi:hypothetical protein
VITWSEDATPPTIAGCPAPTLNLGCNPASVPTCATYNVTATDGCGTPTVTCTNVTLTNGCVRTRTLTYTAKDACNNSVSCSQVITWTVDTTPPPSQLPGTHARSGLQSDGCQYSDLRHV